MRFAFLPRRLHQQEECSKRRIAANELAGTPTVHNRLIFFLGFFFFSWPLSFHFVSFCLRERERMSWISVARNNSSIRWAAGGWIFFIAENAILSENRTWLINDWLGDDRYHLAYGTLSTIATASIGYGYYNMNKSPHTLALYVSRTHPISQILGGWVFLSLGLVMASQVAPKLQIPVAFIRDDDMSKPSIESPKERPSLPSAWNVQVRCPFDFTDKRRSSSTDSTLHGLERISRHPGLWSFGFIGIGQSMLASTIPQRIWWLGPPAVAWLGGWHSDSRFRRGMGGVLDPMYESQTSNIPFVAILTGKQGSGSWEALIREMKPWNAIVAIGISSLWVLRRIR